MQKIKVSLETFPNTKLMTAEIFKAGYENFLMRDKLFVNFYMWYRSHIYITVTTLHSVQAKTSDRTSVIGANEILRENIMLGGHLMFYIVPAKEWTVVILRRLLIKLMIQGNSQWHPEIENINLVVLIWNSGNRKPKHSWGTISLLASMRLVLLSLRERYDFGQLPHTSSAVILFQAWNFSNFSSKMPTAPTISFTFKLW